MRNYVMAACLSFALLSSCAAPAPVPPKAEPAEIGAPAAAETISAPRAFVRLWEKPGYFEQLRFATVIGKTLYLGGGPRGLEAVDVDTGFTRWFHTGDFPPDFPPIERENTLYLVEGGRLVELDANKGSELNRFKPRQGFLTPAYPAERYVLFGSGDEYAYAVTPDKGARIWRRSLDAFPIGSAWDGGTRSFILTANGTLYGITLSPLEVSWHRHFSYKDCSTPVVAGKTIYIGSADYYLYAISAPVGELEWKTTLSAPVLSTPLVAPPRVYAATTEKLIHAVDLATHNDLWTLPGDRVVTTTPGHVIFQRKDGEVNWIGMAEAGTGKLISEMTAEGYVMFAGTPDGGIVYAIGEKGNVLAVGDRAMIEAREAAKEAQRKMAAESAPPAAPTPAAEATTAPAAPTPAAEATPAPVAPAPEAAAPETPTAAPAAPAPAKPAPAKPAPPAPKTKAPGKRGR